MKINVYFNLKYFLNIFIITVFLFSNMKNNVLVFHLNTFFVSYFFKKKIIIIYIKYNYKLISKI